jgi:glycosyltransferase involved in cell wall biosynthesis
MKVLFVIPRLEPGGAEKQLEVLVRGLQARDVEVRICSLAGSGPLASTLPSCGAAVEVLGKGSLLDPRPLWRLQRELGHFDPDIVHTWRPGGNVMGRWIACRAGRASVVATAHLPQDAASWWQRWLSRRLHRKTSRWIVSCRDLADQWERQGVPREKLALIPPAITLDLAPHRSDPELRKSLGIPESAYVVACVGRLIPRKAVKDAIWAADILKFLYDQLYLLVIGDGPLRPRLEQFAHDLRVQDRIRFLGWRDDVPDLLRISDVLWLPSHADGLPNSVLEAMALRRPVVATRLPSVAEAVVDGETGFLVPVEDKAALARQTRVLLDNPELRQRMGEAGFRHITRRHLPEHLVAAHLELYRTVIEEHRLARKR